MSQAVPESSAVAPSAGEDPLPIANCQLSIGKTARPRKTRRASSKIETTASKSKREYRKKAKKLHERQGRVARILNATFGPLGKSNPELWDRRAYLMLVGMVYTRLAIDEKEMPTDELVTLAKVLAENRRAAARPADKPPAEPDQPSPEAAGKELPNEFADAVKQLYGAELPAPDDGAAAGGRPARARELPITNYQ